MIESTKNNKKLVKICRGGQTIWQKPRTGLVVDNISVGSISISGRAYPHDAIIEIKAERDGKVIFTATSTMRRMEFNQVLKEPIREDDEVMVRVTAPDFIPSEYSTTVY